jgi:hypothetical protein
MSGSVMILCDREPELVQYRTLNPPSGVLRLKFSVSFELKVSYYWASRRVMCFSFKATGARWAGRHPNNVQEARQPYLTGAAGLGEDG